MFDIKTIKREDLERRYLELVAHVELIKSHADAVVFGADRERLHSGKTAYIIPFEHIESFANTVNQSPKTSLAEHDAEVARKAYLQGGKDFLSKIIHNNIDVDNEQLCGICIGKGAYNYAQQIRNNKG